MLTIIGLVGAKGSGKSTFAKVARERFPSVREGALADRLKVACTNISDWPRVSFDDPASKEVYHTIYTPSAPGFSEPFQLTHHLVASVIAYFGFSPTDATVDPHVGKRLYTPRQLAQYVGTEVLRAIDPEIHCKGLMQDQPQDGVLIVTDIRFPNEYSFFADRYGSNFYPVYIANLKAEREAAKDGHVSESHLERLAAGCRRIDNNGSLEAFETKVQNFMDGVMKMLEVA